MGMILLCSERLNVPYFKTGVPYSRLKSVLCSEISRIKKKKVSVEMLFEDN